MFLSEEGSVPLSSEPPILAVGAIVRDVAAQLQPPFTQLEYPPGQIALTFQEKHLHDPGGTQKLVVDTWVRDEVGRFVERQQAGSS